MAQNNQDFYDIDVYRNDFEDLLQYICLCYNVMLKNKYEINAIKTENQIRTALVKILENKDIRRQYPFFNKYCIKREEPETNQNNIDIGRTDIKVINVRHSLETKEESYIFECKRLDGNLDLNRKYLKDGVYRFVNEQYSTNHGIHGMIGFLIKNIDINKNIEKINKIEESENLQLNTISNIQKIEFNFEFIYQSIHLTNKQEQNIFIYHTIMNFSSFFNK